MTPAIEFQTQAFITPKATWINQTPQPGPLAYSAVLSWREYSWYSSELPKSSLPCSTCFLVTDSMGSGRPMDLR